MLPDRVSNPGPLTYESGAHRIVRYRNKAQQSVSHRSSKSLLSGSMLEKTNITIYLDVLRSPTIFYDLSRFVGSHCSRRDTNGIRADKS